MQLGGLNHNLDQVGQRLAPLAYDTDTYTHHFSQIYAADRTPRGGTKPQYAYMLAPTCERWGVTLQHRTQIMYVPDMAYVTTRLGLGPGSVVMEAGTGSGVFTHFLSRTVAPDGMVHTMEVDAERYKVALEEFEAHGLLGNTVTCTLRNICEDGFGKEYEGGADAVFLDVPNPWDAIPFCEEVLKVGSCLPGLASRHPY